jgi:DNA-binding response OmpR family regulator
MAIDAVGAETDDAAPARKLRVLLVEDEPLIGMLIEDIVVELGFEMVGPAARLDAALAAAREAALDLAILDISLADGQTFPVAAVLREREIPFLFVSGYGEKGLVAPFEGCIMVQKPFEERQLAEAISRALAGRMPPAAVA